MPTCLVPDLVTGNCEQPGDPVWTAAGFSPNNLLFNPLVPPHYDDQTPEHRPHDAGAVHVDDDGHATVQP